MLTSCHTKAGLMVSFILSGMGTSEYRMTETGHAAGDSVRLVIPWRDRTRGKYFANHGGNITPERVKEAFNEWKHKQHLEYIEYCNARGFEITEEPHPDLKEVRAI